MVKTKKHYRYVDPSIKSLVFLAIAVLLITTWEAMPARKQAVSYLVEDKGFKDVYSLSPGTSVVIQKTTRKIELSGGRIKDSFASDSIVIEKPRLTDCFTEAARKIMRIEGVKEVVGKKVDGKYYMYPVYDSSEPN